MDFSLLQRESHHYMLRDILALKPKSLYYGIMTIDPVLRFAWIFYAIFTHDAQHSTIVSFMVSFAEVTRRGMWTLFRVENEHCANVAQYKASRDVPLPYQLDTFASERAEEFAETAEGAGLSSPAVTGRSTGMEPASASVAGSTRGKAGTSSVSGARTPAEESTPAGTLRRRRTDTVGKKSIAVIMAEAHKQDFEKKRKPERSPAAGPAEEEDLHSSEDDDDDSRSLMEDRMEVRDAEELIEQASSHDGGQ